MCFLSQVLASQQEYISKGCDIQRESINVLSKFFQTINDKKLG